MNEISLIGESLDRLFARHAAESEPHILWAMLEEAGLTHPGELGIAAECRLAEAAGFHAVPLPVVETMLAGRLLTDAGMDVPEGALTVAKLSDKANARVAWSELTTHAVFVACQDGGPCRISLVPADRVQADPGRNLADEGRAVLSADAADLANSMPAAADWSTYEAHGALLKAAQMTGAMSRALDFSVDYAGTRKQFGKPLAGFQAIQQQLAVLAEELAAARCGVALAQAEGQQTDQFRFRAAIAKARASEAAKHASAIAHQVHGAIGFAMEHDLQRYTRRLLAWRNEFGSESHWQAVIGQMAAQQGGSGLWRLMIGDE